MGNIPISIFNDGIYFIGIFLYNRLLAKMCQLCLDRYLFMSDFATRDPKRIIDLSRLSH